MLRHSQRGFSILELLIAIALGLLVAAAASAVLVAANSSATLQSASAEIRDDASFGMRFVESRLAMAGLRGIYDASSVLEAKTNSTNTLSGIVFNAASNWKGLTLANISIDIDDLVSTANAAAHLNTDIASDQLVLQFKLQQDMDDCEGRGNYRGEWVVERYFVAKADSNGPDTDLSLYCDAGVYITEPTPSPRTNKLLINRIYNMGVGGRNALIVPRVDYFGVQLGARAAGAGMMAPPIYNTLANYAGQDVVAVRLGLIIRSNADTGNTLLEAPDKFTVLGQEHTLIEDLRADNSSTATEADKKLNRFVRKVYEITQQLPNAVGGAYATDVPQE